MAVSQGIVVVGAMHNSRSLLTYDKEERLNSGAVCVPVLLASACAS